MDNDARPRVAMVADEATVQSMASLDEALQSRFEKLEARGVHTDGEAIAHLCAEMERESSRARGLILRQPPKQLLGYVWSMHFMSVLDDSDKQKENYRPNKHMIGEMQFMLEFVHAVWSCSSELTDERGRLSEAEMAEIFDTLTELRNSTMLYCMVKSRAMTADVGGPRRGNVSFQAMAAWVNIRGRRYQVLEEEFLKFMLRPHDEILWKCYGMGADEVAAGVQAIADSSRTGLARAADNVERGMKAAEASGGPEGLSVDMARQARNAVDDLLNGGICNLSRHTNMSEPLLQDLSYLPGENVEFLAEGELRGTPLRTLPALVKPGIKLGEDYYIADAQFVRDVAYRCIQRGVLARNPDYREEWNGRQKRAVEDAFVEIFAAQLKGASIYRSVYFREPKIGNWAETDLLVAMEDVLVVVEAKAGVMAMDSPAADFDRHMASVDRLILKAYGQCERFLNYLASADSVPIYELRNGERVKIADLDLGGFRTVLPIGLTVESLSPLSTCLNNLTEISPLLGTHGFMSMSVDDLLVLRRFLPTTGELFHYLEARQQAGTVPDTTVVDETEYLGAYISRNRFDTVLREQREEAPFVVWNSYSDVVDRYFRGENAGRGKVPRQDYPAELKAILIFLDRKRPRGWLEMDAAIRNLGSDERENLSKGIAGLKKTLARHDHRRMLIFNGMPFQVWVCASGRSPLEGKVQRQAEVACLIAAAPMTRVLSLHYNRKRRLTNIECLSYATPSRTRDDYLELEREAVAQRARLVDGRNLKGIRWTRRERPKQLRMDICPATKTLG